MLKYNIAVSVVFTCIELGSVTDELFIAEEAGGGWGWLLADTVSSYFCCCVGAGAVAGAGLLLVAGMMKEVEIWELQLQLKLELQLELELAPSEMLGGW